MDMADLIASVIALLLPSPTKEDIGKLPKEKGEKHSIPFELTAAVIIVAGFFILAFL